MVDLVNFQEDGLDDVVSNELEVGVSKVVKQILFPAGKEIINDDDAIASLNQTIHQVASDEASPTGHQNPLPLSSQTHRDLPAFALEIRRRFLEQHSPSRQNQLRIPDRVGNRRWGMREELEEEGGDSNADKEERSSRSKHSRN